MSKILVFGDSLAYGKWDKEGGWVARLRRYIDEKYNLQDGKNFQVYNLSVPGEVVIRMVDRFEKELSARLLMQENTNNKNIVIFAIGINDSCPNNWMTSHQSDEEEFKHAYIEMIETAKKYQCEIICVGLTPVDEEKSKGLLFSNEEVKKYDQYISNITKSEDVKMINFFSFLNKNHFQEMLVDVVHPNDNGHEMLYEQIKSVLQECHFV